MSTPLAYCEDQGDRILVVNANSAKRTALSPEYDAVVLDAMSLAARESRITSVILHGDGGFFCAGGRMWLSDAAYVAAGTVENSGRNPEAFLPLLKEPELP